MVLELPATNWNSSSEISSSLGGRTGDRKDDGVEIGVPEDGSVGSTVLTRASGYHCNSSALDIRP